MESGGTMSMTSGAPSARSMLTSFVFHAVALASLLLVPAEAWHRSPPPKKPVDVVFYRPPHLEVPIPASPLPAPRATTAGGPRPGLPAPAQKPRPNAPQGPDGRGKPDLPPGPEAAPVAEIQPTPAAPVAEAPRQKAGRAGILAFKDQFASLAQDKTAPKLGADARYGAADDVGRPSSRSSLATRTPGSSGGVDLASLSRSVGGGGGGGGGTGAGGGGGIPGVPVGRPILAIASTGGGERPLAGGGQGHSRTDEEIQIVFDRYKASFYRLYNRELRQDSNLSGQMVLRLTIEPDGSVSMCVLQSTDMKAPELVEQVVTRVRTINFGAKDVQAVTIVYPIDFLPSEAGG